MYFSYILPSSVLGDDGAVTPSNRITLGLIGTEGWIHITGGGTLSANPADVLTSVIGPDEVHLYASSGHHRNFLDSIKNRRPAAACAEIGHNATTTCNLAEISARLGRKLRWNPTSECFVNDETADRLLTRAMRSPWYV